MALAKQDGPHDLGPSCRRRSLSNPDCAGGHVEDEAPGARRRRLTSSMLATRYGRYGARRLAALLRDAGWPVNVQRVERILAAAGSDGPGAATQTRTAPVERGRLRSPPQPSGPRREASQSSLESPQSDRCILGIDGRKRHLHSSCMKILLSCTAYAHRLPTGLRQARHEIKPSLPVLARLPPSHSHSTRWLVAHRLSLPYDAPSAF